MDITCLSQQELYPEIWDYLGCNDPKPTTKNITMKATLIIASSLFLIAGMFFALTSDNDQKRYRNSHLMLLASIASGVIAGLLL